MKRSKIIGALALAGVGAAVQAAGLASSPLDADYYPGHPQGESVFRDVAAGANSAWSFTKHELAKMEASGKLDHLAASPLEADYYWRGIVPRASPDAHNYIDEDNPLTPRYYIDHPDGGRG